MKQSTYWPKAFIWKRIHSLSGLWLTLFLTLHLFTNSQAALLVGGNANSFIHSVNSIHDLPYLPAIEILLLAIPFLTHIIWGIQYLQTAKFNSIPSDGTTPSLPEYPRNQAYTWQRITSWILLVLIAGHVIHMRFLEYPLNAQKGAEQFYMVRVGNDSAIYPLSERLGVKLFNAEQIEAEKQKAEANTIDKVPETSPEELIKVQNIEDEKNWISTMTAKPLSSDQLLAVTNSFGTAELLMVRESFKNPAMVVLYTVLVLSACFHGFNGLWTFMITWGVTLSVPAQNGMRKIAYGLMLIITCLGLAAIWGTWLTV